MIFFSHAAGQDLSRFQNRGTNSSVGNNNDSLNIEDIKVKSKIVSWQLKNQFSSRDSFIIDSTTINFHNFDSALKKSISNTYLGSLGSPYISNIFFDRDFNADFFFLQNLQGYNVKSSDVSYYNTTTPYASLNYVEGNFRNEQKFNASFTRNIDSLTNFGFQYNVFKNISQYSYQEALHKNILFFASRNTERYNAYFNIINGTNNLVENGGLINPSKIIPRLYNLPTGIESQNKSFSVFSSFEYFMGEIPFLKKILNDSTMHDFIPKYAVQYSIQLNHYKRQLIEKNVNGTFFDTIFIRNNNHIDSASFKKFSHIFQLKSFENKHRKFTFGKRVFVENEFVKAIHPLAYGQRSYLFSNVYLGGEIYQQSNDFLRWKVNARFATLGRNIGDAIIKGEIDKPIVLKNDTCALSIKGWYQDISANIFQEHWYSNHYKWENNFRKQHEVVLQSKFQYPKIYLSVGLDYALYSNYIYGNIFAQPDQYEGEFSIISAWLNKDIVFGRFVWSNKLVWQELSTDVVLHLPALCLYSSFYYSHYLFKVMQIQLGAEMYYNSMFYADLYNPATSQFYLQNDVLVGGITNIGFFANAKLKRTSAFAQLTNVNRNPYYSFGEHFSSPRYAIERIAFRFGLFWTFYD